MVGMDGGGDVFEVVAHYGVGVRSGWRCGFAGRGVRVVAIVGEGWWRKRRRRSFAYVIFVAAKQNAGRQAKPCLGNVRHGMARLLYFQLATRISDLGSLGQGYLSIP